MYLQFYIVLLERVTYVKKAESVEEWGSLAHTFALPSMFCFSLFKNGRVTKLFFLPSYQVFSPVTKFFFTFKKRSEAKFP